MVHQKIDFKKMVHQKLDFKKMVHQKLDFKKMVHQKLFLHRVNRYQCTFRLVVVPIVSLEILINQLLLFDQFWPLPACL